MIVNLPQTISVIAVSSLTIIAVIVGIQLIFLLKELRTSLGRFNNVLTSAETTIGKFAQPLTGIVGLVEGIRQSTQIIEIISSFLNRNQKPEPPAGLGNIHDTY